MVVRLTYVIRLVIVDQNGRLLYRVLDFFGRVLYNGRFKGVKMLVAINIGILLYMVASALLIYFLIKEY